MRGRKGERFFFVCVRERLSECEREKECRMHVFIVDDS